MSLVNEYTFHTQTGTALEDLVGTNNGTLGGATLPSWGKGLDSSKRRDYLSFTGNHGATVGDYNNVALGVSDFQYGATGTFTIVCLCKIPSTISQNQGLFLSGNDATLGEIIMLAFADGKLYFGCQNTAGGNRAYRTANAYNDDKWHLVIGNYSNGSVGIYIDGVQDNGTAYTTGSVAGNLYNSNHNVILGCRINGTSKNYDFGGDIAYFANYNHALSTDEIKRITEEKLLGVNTRATGATYPYLAPKNTVRDGLVNLYYLDSPDGVDTVKDYAGSNDGTKGGTTKPTSIVVSNGMNALSFTNGSIGLDLADFRYTRSNDFSFCAWFRTTYTAVGQFILSNYYRTDTAGIHLTYDPTDGVRFGVTDSANKWYYVVSNNSYSDGEWHFAVGTHTASTGVVNLFVDAVDVATTTGGTPRTGDYWHPSGVAKISTVSANSPSSLPIVGDIAMVANYSKVLTPTEIDQIYRDTYIS